MKKIVFFTIFLSAFGAKAQSINNKGITETYAGIGFGPLQIVLSEYFSGFNYPSNYNLITTDLLSGSMGVDYFTGKYFSIGGQINYYQRSLRTINAAGIEERGNFQLITPMIKIKANWLNREKVSLYSNYLLGIGFGTMRKFSTLKNETAIFPAGQYNFIGLRVGRDIAFFAEVGSGFQGVLTVGLSARFK